MLESRVVGNVNPQTYSESWSSREVRTKRLPQKDCGWQNPEEEANSHLEFLRSLASSPDCIGHAAPPQTSSMRDFLSPFAMIISYSQSPTVYPRLIVYNSLHFRNKMRSSRTIAVLNPLFTHWRRFEC